MVGDRSDQGENSGLEQARRIHSVCEDFERRWRDGDRALIEDLLESVEHGDRPALDRPRASQGLGRHGPDRMAATPLH